MTIRILIADDHDVVRQGLQMFLSMIPSWKSSPRPATGPRHWSSRNSSGRT
jgi:DNA-binding NarL/FixJ family response regulator